MSEFNLSDKFDFVSLPHGRAVVQSAYATVLLKEVIPFIDHPAPGDPPDASRGRGGVQRFQLAHPKLAGVVVRPGRRGGLIGPLLKDLYCGKQRALQELVISQMAIKSGLVVPEVVAVILKPKLPGLYRTWVVMREITNVRELPDYLAELKSLDNPAQFRRKAELVRAVLDSLMAFQQAGFYHPDLNLRNLLVQRNEAGHLVVWLVDLDRVRHYEKLTFNQCLGNLFRLTRSLVKLGWGGLITPSDRLRLLKQYLKMLGKDNPVVVEEASRNCTSHLRRHLLWWRLTVEKPILTTKTEPNGLP